MAYEIVCGLEIHTELHTRSKVFCEDDTTFGAPPNSQISPISLGLPGTLPVLNDAALDLALLTALACHCEIPPQTTFDRKHYYYPDLPKNYQISQQYHPLGTGGYVDIVVDDRPQRIRINNIHLEEDAGKLVHPVDPGSRGLTWVDLNRAGMPLLEIVTEPDMHSLRELEVFMQSFRSILRYLEVSDCKMEEGSLRFEVNVSIRPQGAPVLGSKVEIKNIGSIKAALRAARFEYDRQQEVIDARGVVLQETRLWDDEKGETRSMRSKEVAKDYRYLPDPDLVPVTVSAARLERLSAAIPELQAPKQERFVQQYGLPAYDASVLVADRRIAEYFEECCRRHASPKLFSNWIMVNVLRFLDEGNLQIQDFPVQPDRLAQIVCMLESALLSSSAAKKVFEAMVAGDPRSAEEVAGALDLLQQSDADALENLVQAVIAANPGPVDDYRAGKSKALTFLMGQVMRQSKGKANPQVVTDILLQMLNG